VAPPLPGKKRDPEKREMGSPAKKRRKDRERKETEPINPQKTLLEN